VDLTFYATAAQVIPVLLLILVFEFRLFGGTHGRGEWWASSREPRPGERVGTLNALVGVLFLGLLFAAEVMALDAVRTGDASTAAEIVVSAALLLALLVVLLVPTGPFLAILLDRTPLYRLRVALMRRSGRLAPQAPDPPRAGDPSPAPTDSGREQSPGLPGSERGGPEG
jgi:hypothetical protein